MSAPNERDGADIIALARQFGLDGIRPPAKQDAYNLAATSTAASSAQRPAATTAGSVTSISDPIALARQYRLAGVRGSDE